MHYLVERVRLLAEKIPGLSVLLMNGWERSRNYPANTYPYRPDSHFVYFFGLMPAGSVGIIVDGQAHVFVQPVTLDDAVWSGPGPSMESLAQESGAQIHALTELVGFVRKVEPKSWAALPNQDPKSLVLFSELIGRVPGHENYAQDRELAYAVASLRLHADAAAEKELRRACQVNVVAHLMAIEHTKPGMSEADICGLLQACIISEGMTMSFEPIVSVKGERLHQPHYDGQLSNGDLLLVDFGTESHTCWASDITNTWPVSGRFTPKQRDIYNIVVKAHQECAALLAPGFDYREVHARANYVIAQGLADLGILRGRPEEIIERNAQALFFPHGIGHLLGMDAHDMEDLGDIPGYALNRERSTLFGQKWLRLSRPLEKGMTVTIEPGIYFIPELLDDENRRKEFADCVNWQTLDTFREVRGIRVERDYLLQDSGAELLTPGMPITAEEIEQRVGCRA